MERIETGQPGHKEIDAFAEKLAVPEFTGNIHGAVNSGKKITRLYALTTAEEEKYTAFVAEHQKTCRPFARSRELAWENQFEFRFCDNSITTVIEAACTQCGVKSDLTDYDNL